MLELVREWGSTIGTLGTFATVGIMLWRASAFFTATREEFKFINRTVTRVELEMKEFRTENKDEHKALNRRIEGKVSK